jgi:protein-S-isoprenylcysteine O-methyltransferase Ste14
MYVAVFALVVGQGLLFGRTSVLEWGLAFWVLTHLFVVFYEEPHLRRTFGSEYDAYCAAVHRWIPRLRPYSASAPEGT